MTRQVRTLVLGGFALLVGSCVRYERAGGKLASDVAPGLESVNYYQCFSSPRLLAGGPYRSYPNEKECLDYLSESCIAYCNPNASWYFAPGTGEGCGVYPPGGWFQYCVCQIACDDKAACPQFPSACLANTCSGNNVVLNDENQPCGEFCIGWGVHYCFILDGSFEACSYYGQNACMCGETVGITAGCTPIPPPDGSEAVKWPGALPPPQKQ